MKKEISIEEFMKETFSEEFISEASVEYIKSKTEVGRFVMSRCVKDTLEKSRKGLDKLNSAMQLWNES